MRLTGETTVSMAGPELQSPGPLLETREVAESEYLAWDEFVHAHPHGSPFHLIAWKKTIEESHPYKPVYLLTRDTERIRAILPIFLVKNFVVGKALISTPFGVYGGILADSDIARQTLYRHLKELGVRLGVDFIELRNVFPEQCVGEPNVSRYVTFTQALQPDENVLMESLPKKTRNLVRKALKTPFTIRYGIRDAGRLHDLMVRNMRRLGTPCFSRHYFNRVLANFGDMVDIREVWHDGRAMAASVNFFYRGQMHTYNAAADTRFNNLGPNTFMYYDHIRWAGQSGFELFDFGRSKRGTGVFEFKRHWQTTMRELPYEIILVRRKSLPNLSPSNAKFALAIQLWRKVPLFITRILGPRLIRLFP